LCASPAASGLSPSLSMAAVISQKILSLPASPSTDLKVVTAESILLSAARAASAVKQSAAETRRGRVMACSPTEGASWGTGGKESGGNPPPSATQCQQWRR